MNGACNIEICFGPAPWGPGEGSKGQISFNFNYKVNFKAVILLPAHPASFACNSIADLSLKIVFWTHKFAVGLIDMGNSESQDP